MQKGVKVETVESQRLSHFPASGHCQCLEASETTTNVFTGDKGSNERHVKVFITCLCMKHLLGIMYHSHIKSPTEHSML